MLEGQVLRHGVAEAQGLIAAAEGDLPGAGAAVFNNAVAAPAGRRRRRQPGRVGDLREKNDPTEFADHFTGAKVDGGNALGVQYVRRRFRWKTIGSVHRVPAAALLQRLHVAGAAGVQERFAYVFRLGEWGVEHRRHLRLVFLQDLDHGVGRIALDQCGLRQRRVVLFSGIVEFFEAKLLILQRVNHFMNEDAALVGTGEVVVDEQGFIVDAVITLQMLIRAFRTRDHLDGHRRLERQAAHGGYILFELAHRRIELGVGRSGCDGDGPCRQQKESSDRERNHIHEKAFIAK